MKTFLLSLALLFFPAIALASGITVSPDKLQFEVSSGVRSKDMVVANPTANKQSFEIYPDEFSTAISVSPASFTLEAGGRKNVTITIHPSKLSHNISSTTISVLGKPITGSQVQVNTGVKLPITITATVPWYRKLLVPIVAAVLIIAIGSNFYHTRKHKPV